MGITTTIIAALIMLYNRSYVASSIAFTSKRKGSIKVGININTKIPKNIINASKRK